MDNFAGRIAAITGAADGMGRSLAQLLAMEGCAVGLCDINAEGLDETARLIRAETPSARVVTHQCDVSSEEELSAFRDAIATGFGTDTLNLLFNNAGIAGGGSMIDAPRDQWERTFNVCWYGVYYGTRVFLPMLTAADEAHIINTSSVNGFWASLGPDRPHTAYSAAKFAVKGFTEALLTDLAVHAPHIKASVVMPGHIGTGIAANSVVAHGEQPDPLMVEMAAQFRNTAPMTADEAAEVILDGVREERWRILVGADAHVLDLAVRDEPEAAYDPDFRDRLAGHFQGVTNRDD